MISKNETIRKPTITPGQDIYNGRTEQLLYKALILNFLNRNESGLFCNRVIRHFEKQIYNLHTPSIIEILSR